MQRTEEKKWQPNVKCSIYFFSPFGFTFKERVKKCKGKDRIVLFEIIMAQGIKMYEKQMFIISIQQALQKHRKQIVKIIALQP